MAIPDLRHVLEDVKRRYPSPWRRAHTEGTVPAGMSGISTRAQSELWIRLAAWACHQVDARAGLNGKRGTDTLSQDVISFRIDDWVREAADVIGSAGSPSAHIVWNPFPPGNESTGKWIAPREISDREVAEIMGDPFEPPVEPPVEPPQQPPGEPPSQPPSASARHALRSFHGTLVTFEQNTGFVIGNRTDVTAEQKVRIIPDPSNPTHGWIEDAFGHNLLTDDDGNVTFGHTDDHTRKYFGLWQRDGRLSIQSGKSLKWLRMGAGDEGFWIHFNGPMPQFEGDPNNEPGDYETFTVEEVAGAQPGQPGEPGQPPSARRTGNVRVHGRIWEDDQGPYYGVGASLFFGQWAMKHDVERFDRFCEFFASYGMHYIRNLGQIHGGPWSAEDHSQGGRFPDRDWRSWQKRDMYWDDPQVFEYAAASTERAYTKYGLRTEWTIFGGGQGLPNEAERFRFAERFLREVVIPRPHMVQHVEGGNEWWQTYNQSRDINEMRRLGKFMRQILDDAGLSWMGVATSSPAASEPFETAWSPLYEGLGLNLATIHFDRDYQEDGWRPVRQPWDAQFVPGIGGLLMSHNEPIGPGSSVADENDPLRIAMAAVVNMTCGGNAYVYHCDAGIWSQPDRREYPWDHVNGREIPKAIMKAISLMPADGARWPRWNHHWTGSQHNPGHPFADVGEVERTFGRNYAITSDSHYFTTPIHVRGTMHIKPRWKSRVEVLNPITGDVLHTWDANGSQTFDLPGADNGGLGAYIIRGTNR